MVLEVSSGISFSDIEHIDLKIRVKKGLAFILGKVYLNERFEFRVFGFEDKILENDLPIYLERMESEVSESGIEFKYSTTKWGWFWKLEKTMWLATSGKILTPHTCPACVLIDNALIK